MKRWQEVGVLLGGKILGFEKVGRFVRRKFDLGTRLAFWCPW